jgi:hypothetical protein
LFSQIKFLGFLENAKMKAVKKFASCGEKVFPAPDAMQRTETDPGEEARSIRSSSEGGTLASSSGCGSRTDRDNDEKPPDTFYSIIEGAHGAAVDESNIWTPA